MRLLEGVPTRLPRGPRENGVDLVTFAQFESQCRTALAVRAPDFGWRASFWTEDFEREWHVQVITDRADVDLTLYPANLSTTPEETADALLQMLAEAARPGPDPKQ